MTAGMWDFQIDRMHGLYDSRGIPWLTPDEEAVLRAYVHAHAGTG
jgi:hypothetical protein